MKKLIGLILTVSVATLAGCDEAASPTPPPKVVEKPSVIPKNMPETPSYLSLINIAGYLPQFTSEAENAASKTGLSNAINIGNSIDRVPLLGRTETIDGAKAYAILAASQSQAFRNGIEQIGASYGRDGMIAKIIANPAMVRSIPGYSEAKTYAGTATGEQFAKIDTAAATVKKAAYDLQLQSWAKVAQDKQIHLTKMASNWNLPLQQSNFDPKSISYTPVQLADTGTETNSGASIANVNDDVIAAAALHILRADSETLTTMKIGSGSSCAYRAYLNSRMCMSATKYPFEHAFCISEHGQEEVKDCFAEAVGYPKAVVKKEKSPTAITIPIKLKNTKKTTTTTTTKKTTTTTKKK
jgi:hypothetical protein